MVFIFTDLFSCRHGKSCPYIIIVNLLPLCYNADKVKKGDDFL